MREILKQPLTFLLRSFRQLVIFVCATASNHSLITRYILVYILMWVIFLCLWFSYNRYTSCSQVIVDLDWITKINAAADCMPPKKYFSFSLLVYNIQTHNTVFIN